MRGVTHVSVGLAAVILAGSAPIGAAQVAAAAVGSLLPDIDRPGSTITRRALPLFGASRAGLIALGLALVAAWYMFSPRLPLLVPGLFVLAVGLLPHRGVTHSLFGAAAAILAVYFYAADLLFPFAAGYLLHLAADVLSGSAPLLWPLSFRLSIAGSGLGRVLDLLFLLLSWAVIGWWAVSLI